MIWHFATRANRIEREESDAWHLRISRRWKEYDNHQYGATLFYHQETGRWDHAVRHDNGEMPRLTPLLPDLTDLLADLFVKTAPDGQWTLTVGRNNWSIWRPAIYLWLLVFGAVVAVVRERNPKMALVILPAVLHSGLLVLINPAQDARYQYPVILAFMVLWPFLFRGAADDNVTGGNHGNQ
jgi:hypothetical protein